jgi:hypothetical protein
VDNNYLDLGMNQSGFVHTLPSSRLTCTPLLMHSPKPFFSNIHVILSFS